MAYNVMTKKASKSPLDFDAPEEATVEKKLLLKPGKYKMSVAYTWGSSLHKYSREYTFSTYPAETFVKDKEGYISGTFLTTEIFTEIFEKDKKHLKENKLLTK